MNLPNHDIPPPAAIGEQNPIGEVDGELTCAICIESIQAGQPKGVLGCDHPYHLFCLLQLLRRGPNQTCPLCRALIPDEEQEENKVNVDNVVDGLFVRNDWVNLKTGALLWGMSLVGIVCIPFLMLTELVYIPARRVQRWQLRRQRRDENQAV